MLLSPIPTDARSGRVTSDKAIFLSHAHVDRVLADLLRNTLVLGGVRENQVFYSSSRATGIPSGEDVRPYLQRALRDAGLVIELLSETFLRRPICLMELGGAWALGTPTYPILVPPLTRYLAVQNIGDVQMGILGSEGDLNDLFDELHDRLSKDVGVQAAIRRGIAPFAISKSSCPPSSPRPRQAPRYQADRRFPLQQSMRHHHSQSHAALLRMIVST